MRIRALSIFVLLIIAFPTTAEDTKLRLETINLSYHFDRSKDYNERHDGLLIGVDNWAAGRYLNSFDRWSTIIVYGDTATWCKLPFREYGDWGWMIAAADNYSSGINDVVISPFLTYKPKIAPYIKITSNVAITVLGLSIPLN